MAKNFVCGRCAAVVKGAPPYMTRDGFPICSECLEKYRIRTVKTLDEIILMREVPKVMNAIPGVNKPINKPVTKPVSKPVTKPVEPIKKPVKGAVEVDDDPFKEDFKVSGPLDFANATFENEDEINEQIEQARAYDEAKPAMSFGAKVEEESVEIKPKKEVVEPTHIEPEKAEEVKPVYAEPKKVEEVKPVHVEPKKEEVVEPAHIEPKKEEAKASTDSSVDYLKLAEDLERFSQLAKAGILSDEEFKAIKAKIISKML